MVTLTLSLTHLAVRAVHVIAMAALLGGALLCWGMFRRGVRYDMPEAYALRVAATYEWVFWTAAGLLVLTGVGNLGAMAPAIPAVLTPWGLGFAVKLVGTIGLLIGSIVRTLGVVGLRRREGQPTAATVDRLGSGYAATALLLFAIVAVAEVLAHG